MSISFGQWCKENHREKLLQAWDDENTISPFEINGWTKQKAIFRCYKNPEHKICIRLQNIVSGYVKDIYCKKCHSFAQWCIDNKREFFLKQWSDVDNSKSPWEVGKYCDAKKIFICPEDPKHRIKVSPTSIVSHDSKEFSCPVCKSLGTFIDKNYGHNYLEQHWDYEQNKISPYEIPAHSRKKAYFRCLDNAAHGSYLMETQSFSRGYRCQYCSGRNVVASESLGSTYPDVVKIWSSKNTKTPFEYSPKTGAKIWWKCAAGIHDDYQRTGNSSFRMEYRCPKCQENMTRSVIA